ncbi:MAG: excinuclease ABC subunit UvrA [Acidobacteriota bacterium]
MSPINGSPMNNSSAIEVVSTTTHNLKGISCRIPHGQLTVVTGPSGAGKSSLAFDTVYAEAQRRFVESLSTYARQFLEQMERPPVDAMHGILPAVALEAKNAIKNARSTVGTITEIHDILSLFFTHLGQIACPDCDGNVARHSAQEVADRLVRRDDGAITLLVALPRPRKKANEKLQELVRQGYFRRLKEDGTIERLTPSARWKKAWEPLDLVLGRYRTGDETVSARLGAAIEEAFRLASGRLIVLDEDGNRQYFGRELTCDGCGAVLREPQPALFSFNSPLGACPTCQGFGRVIGIDKNRVVPDPTKSLAEQPIAPWNTPAYEELYEDLFTACHERGVPIDVPWHDLDPVDRDWIWSGEGGFTNLDGFFGWLERRNYKMHVRVLLARYRAYDRCTECDGLRLRPEALAVRVHGKSIADLSTMSIEGLLRWLADTPFKRRELRVGGELIQQLTERLETLERVGLDYLTLHRQARTLSGGESQRIQLATALGTGLTSTLYVLDEPTIGLHPQDSERLLALLHDLAKRGNTVLVVEHDRTLITGADWLIDLGPQAGEHGGRIVAEGTVDEVLSVGESLTAQYLRKRPRTHAREHSDRYRRERGLASRAETLRKRPRVRVVGARAHNLRGIDVEFPLGALVAITGVSGSGKSTLVENVLYGTYQRSRGVVDVEPGEVDALEGLEKVSDVTLVDQRPLGRSSRSNPVTYIKAYDLIRKLFAQTEKARRTGVKPGDFSFNLDRGRCPECKGTGTVEVDMQFMAPVTVTCDACQGRRFKPDILAIHYHGRSIDQVLEMTVDEAIQWFGDQTRLVRRLEALTAVGLGYLRLGQPTSTLSGGEAQRLKLASFLDRPATDAPQLFIFDEPTTGLHLSDIDLLYGTLRRLVQRGDGVVVVEHSLDLVARADWIVDLGPGGGIHGGDVLYCGSLDGFLDTTESPTADELRKHMRWPSSPRPRRAVG